MITQLGEVDTLDTVGSALRYDRQTLQVAWVGGAFAAYLTEPGRVVVQGCGATLEAALADLAKRRAWEV